jgi:hypothetical protein
VNVLLREWKEEVLLQMHGISVPGMPALGAEYKTHEYAHPSVNTSFDSDIASPSPYRHQCAQYSRLGRWVDVRSRGLEEALTRVESTTASLVEENRRAVEESRRTAEENQQLRQENETLRRQVAGRW